MRVAALLLPLLALASCDEDEPARRDTPPDPSALPSLSDPADWEIGPVVDGKNYSVGLPLRPGATLDGWMFAFPQPRVENGHVHYVTARARERFTGRTAVRMRFRIEAEEGVEFRGKSCPEGPTGVTLYLQRRGDDWSTDGWRWWATFATQTPIEPNKSYEIAAPLAGPWTSVQTLGVSTPEGARAFAATLDDPGRVGFTFLDCTGYGHGAYATGPARMVVTYFAVE
jgi:hypothetical protein